MPEVSARPVGALLDRRPVLVDSVLVVVLGGPLALIGLGFTPGSLERVALSGLAGLAMTLPLAVRRLFPGAVLVVVCIVGALQLAALSAAGSIALLPADLGFLVAVYTVTAHARTRFGRWVGLPVGLGAAVVVAGFVGWALLAVLVLTVLLAYGAGVLRRTRRAYVAGLADRADAAEVERTQQLRLAESAERARIAREMHDVVAHSLSVIIVQANGGAYAARSDPARAVEVLETISTTGREALGQMRHLLGVLREEPAGPDGAGRPAPRPAAPHAPQPGLSDLPELVRRTAATGLGISADLAGAVDGADIPAGTGLVAYRVVQESLTNVLKHAGRVGRVQVSVTRRDGRLRLEVADDGRGASAGLADGAPAANGVNGAGGHGLRGMRERVALLGGRIATGPRPGGGYRVVATLPVPLRPAGVQPSRSLPVSAGDGWDRAGDRREQQQRR